MLIALAYAAVAISGIGGLMAIRNRRLASLLGLFLASQMLPSIVAFGSSRFRLPLMGVLLLGTAYASTHTRRLRELPPLHLIAILAAVVIVAALIGSRWDAALSPRWG